jgi:hypothetical protein
MKAKIWVLCTVLADENAPAMPAVFADVPNGTARWTQTTTVHIRATPMQPKTGFARLVAPNGAGGS